MKLFEEFGLRKEIVDRLTYGLTEESLKNIMVRSSDIFSSIQYLRQVGVNENVIEDILLNDYELLVPGEDKIKKAFEKFNGINLVTLLNSNSEYMYYLENIY